MRCFLRKAENGYLAPGCDDSQALTSKLAVGEAIEIDWKSRNTRSVKWHRLYFALCKLIYASSEQYRSVDDVHLKLKALAGLYDAVIVLPDGTNAMLIRSIAFDKMTANEWSEAWPRLMDVVHTQILPGIDIVQMQNEIARIAG